MGAGKRMFNEGFYAVRIDEWEQQRIPDTLAMARFQFGVPIAIVASIVGWQLAAHWGEWLAVAGVAYLLLTLFTLLHEVNENARYIRHQLQAQRDAYERTASHFREYKDPDKNVTPFELVDTLDREW